MPKKAEPSFEVKKVIWDMAATVGRDKYELIRRNVDIELEKRRQKAEVFEDTPDVRTIKRIITQDINEIPPEKVISDLPRHVWVLRHDYEDLKRMAEGPSEVRSEDSHQELAGQERERAIAHDVAIFQNANAIMSEYDLNRFLNDVLAYSLLESDRTMIRDFCRFFDYQGNRYVSDRLNGLVDRLLHSLAGLLAFVEVAANTEAATRLEPNHRYHFWSDEVRLFSKRDEELSGAHKPEQDQGADGVGALEDRLSEWFGEREYSLEELDEQLFMKWYPVYGHYLAYRRGVRQMLYE